MDFINGNSNSKAINDLLRNARRVKCAVAFIGKDAPFKFESVGGQVQIICDLESGACNPHTVSDLRGVLSIKKMANLHAKVYWTPEKAIISSANLSANGLGAEGDLSRLEEAGVVVTDSNTLVSIRNWFDRLWDNSATAISDSDIEEAKYAWKERQALSQKLQKLYQFRKRARTAKPLLLSAIENPRKFKSTYVVVTWESRSNRAEKFNTEVKTAKMTELGVEVDGYENWDNFPGGANILDFTCKDKSGKNPKFLGTWISPKIPYQLVTSTNPPIRLTFVQRTELPNYFTIENDIYFISSTETKVLCGAIGNIIRLSNPESDGGILISLSKLLATEKFKNGFRKALKSSKP